MSHRQAIIVAGPTASGKSALAVQLAERLGGTVINADAMQCYRELRILTARPTAAEEERAPHLLYGVRAAAEPATASWWREAALDAMAEAESAGRIAILCGGSGFYLEALVHGLAPLPRPTEEARAEARQLLASLGPATLHARLEAVDPATAARLRPSDSQRLARAWEIWRTSGQGLVAWQAAGRPKPPAWRFTAILFDPPRAALKEAIERRFARMLEAGALDEVRALSALGLEPSLPVLRAHGVAELAAYLDGRQALEEATRQTLRAIGGYTKRQATWFRHHALAEPTRTHTIHACAAGITKFEAKKVAEFAIFVREAG